MIVGVYTVSALSVERCIAVVDIQKKFSFKHKTFFTILCLLVIWLIGFLFSLPMVLSFESNVSNDGAYSCESNWTDRQVNGFFIIKYVFIFLIPFIAIVVSSVKLLLFLNKWRKKFSKFKSLRASYSSNTPKVKLETGLIFFIFLI